MQRQTARRSPKQKRGKRQEASSAVKVSSRDPLLDYKRPRLIELLHEARAERDKVIQQAKAERIEAERRAQNEHEQQLEKTIMHSHSSCNEP